MEITLPLESRVIVIIGGTTGRFLAVDGGREVSEGQLS